MPFTARNVDPLCSSIHLALPSERITQQFPSINNSTCFQSSKLRTQHTDPLCKSS